MINSLFPVISATDVGATRDFYTHLFDLRVVYDSGWYVQLQSTSPNTQLGIVASDHASVPEAYRALPRGVLVSLEVDDASALYERARGLGLRIAYELRDEVFGQRHFMTVDPTGLLVDVIELIPFAASEAEFLVTT